MTKFKFLSELEEKLSGLPKSDINERLQFYSEMIDDRVEEGLSEEQAIADIGSSDEIAEQIIRETPLVKIVKKRLEPKRRLTAWEIVLIVLGFPVWLPILISIFAVALSVYATLWSLIVSLWAVFASFVGGGFGGILSGLLLSFTPNLPSGLFLIFAGIFLLGLSVLLFFGSREATRGTAILTKKIALWIKRLFLRKEAA